MTKRLGHAPIAMRHCEGIDDLENVGDFCWRGTELKPVLVLMIPLASPAGKVMSRWTIDHKNHCNASWSWDRNKSKPTLKPSLHAIGIWHGHVKAGMLVEA